MLIFMNLHHRYYKVMTLTVDNEVSIYWLYYYHRKYM